MTRAVVTRVITANVPIRRMTPAQRAKALKAVLDRQPTYAGLQEWGEDLLLAGAQQRGYGHARAKGGPPVLYDRGRTQPLHVRPVRLARAEFVGHLIGRKDRLGPSIATEVIFEDDVLGEVALLGGHFTAEVQFEGSYREDIAHRLRVARHKRERRRYSRRLRHHAERGRIAFGTVDGNFDDLELRGLVSCWDGRKQEGTLGGRTVDVVFSGRRAADVHTFATGSDHRAVAADY